MIVLYGFPASNYHNKVKVALLQKQLPFEERQVALSKDSRDLGRAATRKIPFLEDDGRVIVESQAILEYLEEAYPQLPLLPRDPGERARCRELIAVIELYLELPARRLYPQAFFGKTVSEETRDEVAQHLERGASALAKLARFGPYVGGPQFTIADCAAAVHLPLVSRAGVRVLGRDPLERLAALEEYRRLLEQQPAYARVQADRKAGEAAMAASRSSPSRG